MKSLIIPLPRKNIDTDLIIPADFLKGTSKEGLGQYLFDRLRKDDPTFPFNLEKYRQASILVTQDNFGCGSSREHAAWALKDWGIAAIIAPSYSDIFYNNALKNFLLPIKLDAEIVESMLERAAEIDLVLEIDLEKQRVILPGGEFYDFHINPYRKYCLTKNLDDLDYLLEAKDEIAAFEKKRDQNLFFDLNKI